MSKAVTASNGLAAAASPYLRSAAHQPVAWEQWSDAAFERAGREDKPILLDIGAVWCHWCHVIDRESYENAEIAEVINRHYVAVKVDRDERPDIDARYQMAVSALTGQGGWPLTAILTPDGKPFFGGTYFPPDDRYGRPGMKRILETIAHNYRTHREEIHTSAGQIAAALEKVEIHRPEGRAGSGTVQAIVANIESLYDPAHGGFGQAPKFPHPFAVELLIDQFLEHGERRLLDVVTSTLEAMGRGGVYDQIGEGFHRYSVDEHWGVPHFEKMSYDNSELLKNYLHAYQDTGNDLYREVAEGTIGWVTDVLSDQQRGGFYASQDADQTLDDDGDYFTWTLDEVRSVLTPEEARAIELYYDVQPHGEMHHNPAKNVLWVASSAEQIAKTLNSSVGDVWDKIGSAENKMLAARRKRPTPFVDTTIYVAWNAMFVSAYLEASKILVSWMAEECRAFALKTLDRIIEEAWDESKGLGHRVGGPKLEGSLDDQVFAAAALLDAYEVTLNRRYFEIAERAMRLAVERFGDPEGGGFFDRAKDAAPMGGLEVRRKPLQDSPTPGANAVAAIVLDRLYSFTGERVYRDWAEKTLEAFAGRVAQYGLFAATYGLAVLLHTRGVLEVVVLGAAGDSKAAELEKAANEVFRFGKSVLRVTPENVASASLAPALRETIPHLDATKAQALVCVETTCYPPITDPAELKAKLAEAGTRATGASAAGKPHRALRTAQG